MIAPIPDIGPISGPSRSITGIDGVPGMGMPAPMAPLSPPDEVADPSRTPGVGGFGTMLTRAMGGLANQVQTSDRMAQLAATGQLSDPTEAIVEASKSELALSTAVQVRNKLIESWQELSRMPV